MDWIDVMAAADLAPGATATVELPGTDGGQPERPQDVVVWRTAGGALVACEARCPHQWAHLGQVGAVDGEELVCRSHFWRFDRAGNGSKLSATGRRDEKAPVRVLEVVERDGRILLARDPSARHLFGSHGP